jgi:signal transduction histidine kinase
VKNPIRVLLVEDSEDDAVLLERALARAGWAATLERVETEAALRAALPRSFDVVVADWVVPGFSGMDALRVANEVAPDLPVVIWSGQVDEEMAVSALRAGAKDFVSKGNLARLSPALARELAEAQARRERRHAERELDRAREALDRARRLELAGTLAGQVAHDVGNLLAPLVLAAEQFQRHVEPAHPAQKYCERVLAGLRRLADLNQDLLTLGRRGGLRLERTDLNAVVREALAGGREPPPTLELSVALDDALPHVLGAPAQLARVVANLLANARDAMGDRGALAVRTRGIVLDGGGPRDHVGPHAVVEIADSGCGIPAEHRERIFEPFFTTKRTGPVRGSGLGLAIVQAIVADHCGSVEVESEVGRGSTFRVTIPAASAAVG